MHDPVNALTLISQVWPRVKGTLWVHMYIFSVWPNVVHWVYPHNQM